MTTATQQSAAVHRLAIRRVAVIGAWGSGKSAFSRALSVRLGVPHIELDALHWRPDWTALGIEEFRARVTESIQQPGWVVDGNYSKTRDLVWSAADTVIWLDYSLPLVLWRLLHRTLMRSITGEVLWGTNKERFWRQFVPPDGLFPWVLSTHPKYRREIPAALRRPEYRHVQVVWLRTPGAAARWLSHCQARCGDTGCNKGERSVVKRAASPAGTLGWPAVHDRMS